MAHRVNTEEAPPYGATHHSTLPHILTQEERAQIGKALGILQRTIYGRVLMSSPEIVKNYLQLRFAPSEYEVFSVMFLDSQNRLIITEELFRGTLTQTSVYPREIVREALFHNAAALILAHNHPSGVAEPSKADEHLTAQVKAACALLDIKVLDHIIVSQSGTCSFAERGLL